MVLAADHDLQDIGLAYERWWEVPETIRNMVAGQRNSDLAARAIFGAGYGTFALIRGTVRALQNPWVAAAAVVVAAVATATHRKWYPQASKWAEETIPGIRQAAGTTAGILLGTFEQYWAAATIWRSAQRGRRGQTLTHQVARLLATSLGPLTRTEIAAQLHTEVSERGHQAVMANLSAILEQHQAFCPVTRSRWQLGKEDASLRARAIA